MEDMGTKIQVNIVDSMKTILRSSIEKRSGQVKALRVREQVGHGKRD